jgi:predicted  nucleic acid-binding Zn-ribbon protein
MRKQLRELVTLQEIDALLADLRAATTREDEETTSEQAKETKRVLAERARIAGGLRPEILERYETVRRRHPRAVVPTNRGVCMGCFTVRPTAMATRGGGLEICERCGRILFRLEESEKPAQPDLAPSRSPRRRTASKRR